MNEKWTKWINASINKHFDSNKGSYNVWFDGLDLDPLKTYSQWAEVRIIGPEFTKLPGGQYDVSLILSIMCCSKSHSSNAYASHSLVGQFQKAADSAIVVKTFGETVASSLGCLSLSSKLDTIPWGLMDRGNVQVQQTGIEAAYQMRLEE